MTEHSVDGDTIRSRVQRLRDVLADQALRAAIVARPEHVRYLTGWAAPLPGVVLLTPEAGLLIVPDGTSGGTAADAAGLDVHEFPAYSPAEFIDAQGASAELVRGAVRAIPSHLRGVLGTDLPILDPTSSAIDLTPVLRGWRRTKDDREVDTIRDRVSRLEAAFTVAAGMIRPGVSETDIRTAIYDVLQATTTEAVRLDANLGSGSRSAMAGPFATSRALRDGDLVVLDLYPRLDGYVADLTRTFVVGQPTPRQERHWAVVREALHAAEALLIPGTPVRDIDHAVRTSLALAGVGELHHHVGHGIGLDPWEGPWIGGRSEDRLEVGNVIAIEPGIYIDGWGGMRLEADYVIRVDGPERLDRYPDTLTRI